LTAAIEEVIAWEALERDGQEAGALAKPFFGTREKLPGYAHGE